MNRSPIFCDECSSFALAECDGAFLCVHCLFGVVGSDTELILAGDVCPLPQGTVERPLSGMDAAGQTHP